MRIHFFTAPFTLLSFGSGVASWTVPSTDYE